MLVVNTSATMAAAVDGARASGPTVVHFSTALDDGKWIVELRAPDGSGPVQDASVGEVIDLQGGGCLELLAAHPDPHRPVGSRLWRAEVVVAETVDAYLRAHGRAITYKYVQKSRPLTDYQTIFADESGSAEMPSAARPFTEHLVTRLVTKGINVAPIVLHCGVSSLEAAEAPQPERFRVPATTAWL
ncbi:MAG: S-adenosylmethionine:tRNA ribosyltransferase-isomerase, partial [Actinomycetota bacterium]|nr:S-adenosylmethionine:tRNA ribosyltransferase-isomerase [Actinomycetota bacterium]